jgi:hypothetical protein
MRKAILEILCIILFALTPFKSRGDMLDSWHWRNPGPFGDTMRSVCFANGKFVAVGDGGVIHTSADGVQWDDGQRPVLLTLNRIIYGNGMFLAVGNSGEIVTSTEGANWTPRNSGTGDNLYSVAYGNGRFIACGPGGRLVISTNGVNWSVSTEGTIDLPWITFGNGVFVTAAPNGPYGDLFVKASGDGQTWTTSARLPFTPSMIYPHAVAQAEFGNGVFVVSAEDETSGWPNPTTSPTSHFYRSTDGINWTMGATLPYGPSFLNFKHLFLTFANGLFHECTTYSSTEIVSSADGITFATNAAPNDGFTPCAMAYGSGKYLLMEDPAREWTSTDLTSWTQAFGGLRDTSIYSMVRGPANYVVISGQQILLSPDGINYAIAANSPTGILNSVEFDGSNYVAVGQGGNVYTSTNSTTWVQRNSNASSQLRAVCRGPSRWVAVGANGTVITSPTATAWTLRFSGTANQLNGVAYGNGTFVAAGNVGTIMTSPDGVTWDAQDPGTTADLNSVRFFNGQFFAVGANGTMISSIDGITWSSVNSGTTLPLYTIAAGNGRYLACGADFNLVPNLKSFLSTVFLSSTNGLDWQDITTTVPTGLGPRNVAYLSQSFWVFGDNGMILQSAGADDSSITGAMLPDHSGFQLRVVLNTSLNYRIQSCTNLASDIWEDLVTLTNAPSPFTWVDTNGVGAPMRFYRIKSP